MPRKATTIRLTDTERAALRLAADREKLPETVLMRSVVLRWLAERSYLDEAAKVAASPRKGGRR